MSIVKIALEMCCSEKIHTLPFFVCSCVAANRRDDFQDLVDQSAPTASIQFRLACRGRDGVSRITVSLNDL